MHPSPQRPDPTAAGQGAVIGAIPARYGSERLPGKALERLLGRPMIEHVYRRVSEAGALARVVVLTDDERIARAVEAFGGDCEMTPSECTSGTDRIAWAARRWEAAAVVNVQGDEPLIEPAAVRQVAEHLIAHPDEPMVTLAASAGEAEAGDPNVVKVVVDRGGRALYFSRSAIPYPRRPGSAPLAHLGVYGYQRRALLELAALEPSPLERTEALEQLRALENGIPIRVLVTEATWWGVDTMQDLERTEARMRELAAHD